MLDRMPLHPAGGRGTGVGGCDELFAFTQYVQIMLFNLGRPGGRLRHVAVCEDVAAGKDVGRSRRELDDHGCRWCRGDILLVGEGVGEPLFGAGVAAGQTNPLIAVRARPGSIAKTIMPRLRASGALEDRPGR